MTWILLQASSPPRSSGRKSAEPWPPSWLLTAVALLVMGLATLAFVGEFIRPDYEAPEAVYLMASGVVTAILAFNAKRAADHDE